MVAQRLWQPVAVWSLLHLHLCWWRGDLTATSHRFPHHWVGAGPCVCWPKARWGWEWSYRHSQRKNVTGVYVKIHSPKVGLCIEGRSWHRYHFCCNKSFVMTNTWASWQNTSVDICMLVVTKHLLQQQTCVCQNKYLSWEEKKSHQKYFVMTNIILLWQKFCHSKHTFVVTKDMFCPNKHVFVATNSCHNKTFVKTKVTPVAPPANDNYCVWLSPVP